MDVVKLDFPDKDLFILADGDWRGYRSRPCAKEPETVEWIRSFEKGSVLWDVGASVGPYSLIAAALGHRVVAFEPFAPSYGHLQQNIWLNEMSDLIRSAPIAFSRLPMFNHGRWEASSIHPGSASHGNGSYYLDIISVGVDAFADRTAGPVPSHVKIDVDGAELGVIEGGRELWKQVDSIMVESEPPTVDDITVILSGAGLEMVDSWKRLGETKQHNYLYRRA